MDFDGRYQVISVLGEGAFGRTYLARETSSGDEVVIKRVTIRGLPGWKPLELFEREVAVLRSVRHPGVPRFLDAFQSATSADGGPEMVLVTERIPGESLLAMIERGHHWEEGQARQLLERLLEVLAHLHTLSPPVIHRDIKPGNIIVKPDGQPVLVDFGAVHTLATRAGHQSLTVVGTAGYLPPEQAMGAAVPASDIFALGCTMVHLLTHCHPADLAREGLRLVFADRVGCSPALRAILTRMVEPDLGRRYRAAAQVQHDLQRPIPPRAAALALAGPAPGVPAVRRPAAPPAPIELPPSPRPLTPAAREHIRGLAVLHTAGAVGAATAASVVGWFGVATLGVGSTVMTGALAAAVALVSCVGVAVRGHINQRYEELYRSGIATQGTVQHIKWVTEAGIRYADVRFSYVVDGVVHWGEVHYSGPATTMVTDSLPVLVIHDPLDPKEHIGLLVAT